MKYKILRTDKAQEQLRDNIYYIADNTGSVDLALGYLEKIEVSFNHLQELPESGSIPRYTILKKQGYRVVIVGKHLVFYQIITKEKVVINYVIMDGRIEYQNLI